jgi:hypothetical protein
LSLGSTAIAQFKSARDRTIARDILKTFAKECIQRESNDDEIIKRLEAEAKRANHSGDVQVQKCFENTFSQVAGVFYLYQKICKDVSANGKTIADDAAANQLLEVNKYQTGIRPFHSTLNDCLNAVPDKRGLPYVVPLSGTNLDVRVLESQIDRVQIKFPYAATIPVPAR